MNLSVWTKTRFLELPFGNRIRVSEILLAAVLGLLVGVVFWAAVFGMAFSAEELSPQRAQSNAEGN